MRRNHEPIEPFLAVKAYQFLFFICRYRRFDSQFEQDMYIILFIFRFQKVIPVDLPTAKERFEIFRQCLKGHDISGLDLKALANADSIDFSGELSFKSRNVIPSTFFEKLPFPPFFNRTFYLRFKKLNRNFYL